MVELSSASWPCARNGDPRLHEALLTIQVQRCRNHDFQHVIVLGIPNVTGLRDLDKFHGL